ncbi:MAG: RsmB/NOP family class I SAM-dependent RNA methyltransferase [Planctomycetota bacterium]
MDIRTTSPSWGDEPGAAAADLDYVQQLVDEVLQRCLLDGVQPADVLAQDASLRRAPSAVRAEIVRLGHHVIGRWRRLAFLLQATGANHQDSASHELLAMALIDAGERVSPSLARAVSGPLPNRRAGEAAIAAIADPLQRFAVGYSLPDWLAERVLPMAEAESLAASLLEPPPRTLRANLLRVASRDELVRRLRRRGIDAAPARFSETALHVRGTADVFALEEFRAGLFEQQDEASQLLIAAAAPPPGGRVLDLCCGSGGKTLALAAAMGNRGSILAADVHAGRVRELRRRLPRAGADNVRPLLLEEGNDDALSARRDFAQRADRIVIDAPCTGTGSLRRRPQARWRIAAQDLSQLVGTQRQLLLQAAGDLRGKARLVYATCSLLREENQDQVDWILAQRPDFEVVSLREILGGKRADAISDASGRLLSLRPDRQGTDGFFAAVLRLRRT